MGNGEITVAVSWSGLCSSGVEGVRVGWGPVIEYEPPSGAETDINPLYHH